MLWDKNDLRVLFRVEQLSKHNVGGRVDGYVIYGDAMNLFFTVMPSINSKLFEIFHKK